MADVLDKDFVLDDDHNGAHSTRRHAMGGMRWGQNPSFFPRSPHAGREGNPRNMKHIFTYIFSDIDTRRSVTISVRLAPEMCPVIGN